MRRLDFASKLIFGLKRYSVVKKNMTRYVFEIYEKIRKSLKYLELKTISSARRMCFRHADSISRNIFMIFLRKKE